MNGVQYALQRVHDGENELVHQLLQVAERHHAEHEVHHVCHDLARWSQEHVRLVAEQAADHDLDLSADPSTPNPVARRLREGLATAIGRRPEPGVLLLDDLIGLYLQASQNSLAWEMLAQVAQAERDSELLTLTERCHPQNLRQIRWANTTIKIQTPQILAAL